MKEAKERVDERAVLWALLRLRPLLGGIPSRYLDAATFSEEVRAFAASNMAQAFERTRNPALKIVAKAEGRLRWWPSHC